MKIKNIVDRLASVGHIVAETDHIEAIFNGLPEDYDTFVISVNSRSETYMVEEIESLLLAQETRIEKHIKELDSNVSSVNMAMHNSVHKRQYRGGTSNSSSQHINIRMLMLKAIIQEPEEGTTPFIIVT